MRGFTLIEVLVAVAILGLGLTAILAAQGGTFTAVGHAKHLSQASGLLRCKMSELEEDLRINGFDIQDVEGSGPCCDGATDLPMRCEWRIERPTFPEPKYGDLNLDTKLDIGPGSGNGTGPKAGLAEALGSLAPGKAELPQSGNMSDVAGALAENGGNIADGATQMMMGIVYPEVQQIFQSGTRRITVTALWDEGKIPFKSELVQWVSNARAAGVVSEIPTEEVDDPTMTQSTGAGMGPGNKIDPNFAPKKNTRPP
ncbi:MAG: prepilin-type N-terminal cleavage/methylation domain-containing protein [Polyangiaceae bacterium]